MTQTTRPLAIATPIHADDSSDAAGSFPDRKTSGPKTAAGKRRASLNSLRHGIYADAVLIKGEDRDDYLRFARAIVAGLGVESALEMALAERVVSALWRSRRARRYEQAHLDRFAEEAERKRKALSKALNAVTNHERESDAVQKLGNAERMTADELDHARSALYEVFENNPDRRADEELPDSFWDIFPDRGNVSRKRVAQIADQVREIFEPTLTPGLASGTAAEFWSWAATQHYSQCRQLQIDAINAGREYGAAQRQTVILDATQGDAYDGRRWGGNPHEARAGRILEDAERRLDRQVSRALADLEAARKLRPGA